MTSSPLYFRPLSNGLGPISKSTNETLALNAFNANEACFRQSLHTPLSLTPTLIPPRALKSLLISDQFLPVTLPDISPWCSNHAPTPFDPVSQSNHIPVLMTPRQIPLSSCGQSSRRGVNHSHLCSLRRSSPCLNPEVNINMALFNIRSIQNKCSSVCDLIRDEKIDILFLTEAWLGSDGAIILAPACPPNYNFLHSAREGKKGGGLAIIFSDVFKFKPVSFGDFTSFEYQATSLDNQSSVISINIYRPPKSSKALFLTDISELLSLCSTNYNKILICGDINLHVDNASDAMAMDFIELLHSFDFIQHVAGPTHKYGHTLDLVISKDLNISINRIIDKPQLSDHSVVFFNMTVPGLQVNNSESTITKRFFSPSAVTDFPLHLPATPPLPDNHSVNDLVQHFNDKLKHALDIVAPLKTKRRNGSKAPPWLNEQTRSLKRECRRAERVWRKSGLSVHKLILKNSTVTYNRVRSLARQAYFSGIINENKRNPRILFSTIDRLLNPPQSYRQTLPPSEASCNDFASFFDNKIINIRAEILSNIVSTGTQSSNIAGSNNIVHSRGTLNYFYPVNTEELSKIITQMSSSSCSLDPVPTPFLKDVLDCVIGEILTIVNTSLESGVFPTSLKTAVVRPLIKKHNLDPAVLGNYRPISNLPFLGKILEKIVFQQLDLFLQMNNVYNKFQSGFRKGHSTETALVKVVNDLRMSAAMKNVSVLLLLDLTAAFDTIDYTILLHRLESWVGLSGTVLSWFGSYLTGREYFVSLADFTSVKHTISSGIPQGSILGPLLFSLYMLPLGDLISNYGVNSHFYADDTQIYLSVAPDDPNALDPLLSCLAGIKCWMTDNFLKLNEEKTDVLIIGSDEQKELIRSKLGDLTGGSNNTVKNLGVIIDSDLSFNAHISQVTKTAFFHLRNISRIRAYLSLDDAKTLIHAFVFSRIDYCNALFAGLPKKTTDRLQLVKNAAARVLTKTKKWEHITPVLKSLHWLPVTYRIDFKILLIVYKALHGLAPSYLSDCVSRYEPARPLRSSTADLLDVPPQNKFKIQKYGQSAFCFYGPTAWNNLPLYLRRANSVDSFKAQLKTHLFTLAFN